MIEFKQDQQCKGEGTYSVAQLVGQGLYVIHTRCPGCGVMRALNSAHTIHADGRVTESYLCPGCGFHDYIKLADWKSPGPLVHLVAE